jgi:thiol-disulfide isomerase/thioredoxin
MASTSFGLLVAAIAFVGVGAVLSTPAKTVPKATVTFFLSTDCPVAMTYTPRFQRFVQEFGPKGVQFKALFPNDLEDRADVDRYMNDRGYAFPATLDLGAQEAKRLKVTHVPTVVIKDDKQRVVYVGAFDDNPHGPVVKNSYAAKALEATLSGQPVKVPKTTPTGCLVMPSVAAVPAAKVNYAEHIAPLLNRACVECHRPGEVAPFTLTDYPTAKKWAPMLAAVTSTRKMPPWKAVKGHGEFLGENRLSESEIQTLKNWSDAGAPSGDLKKAPKLPKFPVGWAHGQPDMIFKPERPFNLAAEGADEYRNFVFDPKNKETIWVRMMDVKPGNRRVVHHIIGYIDTSGAADRQVGNTKDGQEGYKTFGGPGFIPYGSLGGWAPGLQPHDTGEERAFEIPPGARLVMQVHYHRTGKLETDQTQMGIYLTKSKPKQAMKLAWLANPSLRLPAGQKDIPIKLTYRVPADVTVYGSLPHMHLLGRTMKATIEFPDGSTKPLVYIDDWDFNWQMQYIFKEPMKVPKGSRILVEGTYDNSADNPRNPNDPPKLVRWGEETTDEMFLLVVPYTVDGQVVP